MTMVLIPLNRVVLLNMDNVADTDEAIQVLIPSNRVVLLNEKNAITAPNIMICLNPLESGRVVKY